MSQFKKRRGSETLIRNSSTTQKIGVPSDSQNQTRLNKQSKISLYEINQTKQYNMINHPILSKQKKEAIFQKLRLEGQVRNRMELRQNFNNYFVHFKHNPLSDPTFTRSKSTNQLLEKPTIQNKKSTQSKHQIYDQVPKDTIIEGVNQLRKAKVFKKSSSPITRKLSAQQISNNWIKQSKKSLKNTKQTQKVIQYKKLQQDKQMSLDDIIKMDDQNYYIDNREINIFHYIKGNHQKILSKEILNKYNFSFRSLVIRYGRMRVPILRELSRFGRQFAMSRDHKSSAGLEHLSGKQMKVDVRSIRYEDIINISCGRLSSKLAKDSLDEEDTSQEQEQIRTKRPSEMDENLRHMPFKGNCQGPNQQFFEVLQYKKMGNNQSENKLQRFCDRIKDNIRSQMKLKASLVNNTIIDKKSHNKINQKVEENISFIANLNVGRIPSAQRAVKINKTSKTRKQAIQIRKLLEAISLHNREQQKIQILLKGNTPNISK